MSISAKKILVVSANRTLHELAAFAFDVVARWTVLSATSVSECLTTAASDAPDAILIDGRTCGNDVLGLAEKLGRIPATGAIRILLLQPAQPDKSALHSHPLLQGVVRESHHPRKLATEVAQVLGWQPWAVKPAN